MAAFNKEWLKAVCGSPKHPAYVSDEITDVSRWSVNRRLVFKSDDKFYEVHYSRGATEMQDEAPFEYEDGDVECREVFPMTREVVVYEART